MSSVISWEMDSNGCIVVPVKVRLLKVLVSSTDRLRISTVSLFVED